MKSAAFSQNNNKSSGIDTNVVLLPKFISQPFHTLQFLLKFFIIYLPQDTIQSHLAGALLSQSSMEGDVVDSKNYRGITLINIISKIYSQILLNRLTKWSIDNETVIDNQFGFQKGKSTIDCIYILHSVIAKTLALKKKLYCCFIDYEK